MGTAEVKAGDFNGAVDGAGIKQVMVDPKTALELIPPQFVEGIGEVLLYGKNKYAANNWMRGMSYATVFGGVLRHLWAWFRGEEIDPVAKGGSGLPHLFHAACGIMFLAWFCHGPDRDLYAATDDRVFKGVQRGKDPNEAHAGVDTDAGVQAGNEATA